jgi:hypothetical protein
MAEQAGPKTAGQAQGEKNTAGAFVQNQIRGPPLEGIVQARASQQASYDLDVNGAKQFQNASMAPPAGKIFDNLYFGEPKYDEIKRAGGDGSGSQQRTVKWVEEQRLAHRRKIREETAHIVPEDKYPKPPVLQQPPPVSDRARLAPDKIKERLERLG